MAKVRAAERFASDGSARALDGASTISANDSQKQPDPTRRTSERVVGFGGFFEKGRGGRCHHWLPQHRNRADNILECGTIRFMAIRPLLLALVVGACNSISGADDLSIAGEDGGTAGPVVGSGGTGPGTGKTPTDGGGGTPQVSSSGVVTVLAPTGLDFGDLPCATAPPSRDVEIRNESNAEITFHATLDGGTRFWLSLSDGKVTAKNSAFISVSTAGIPATGPLGAQTDVLRVTTNAPGDTPHPLDVKISATGVIFNVSPTGTISWGNVTATPVSKQVTIRNDGNISGTIDPNLTLNTLNTYSISPSTPLVIAAGEVGVVKITAGPPKSGPTEKDGRLSFTTTSTLCGPAPSPINLSARRPD